MWNKRRRTKWLIALIVLVVFANTAIGHAFFVTIFDGYSFKGGNYLYGNGSGLFYANDRHFSRAPKDSLGFEELSDFGYHDTVRRFAAYQKENPQDTSKLYRHFRKYPWKFWMWREYLTCSCYSLPYKAEIPEDYSFLGQSHLNISTKAEQEERQRENNRIFEQMVAEGDTLLHLK